MDLMHEHLFRILDDVEARMSSKARFAQLDAERTREDIVDCICGGDKDSWLGRNALLERDNEVEILDAVRTVCATPAMAPADAVKFLLRVVRQQAELIADEECA